MSGDLLADDHEATRRRQVPWSAVASYVFSLLSTFLILAALSHAAPNFDDLWYGALLGIAALVAFGRAAVTRAGLGPLLVAGICVLMLVAGYFTSAPLYLRWKLSEGSFSSWVAREHIQSDLEKPFRIGLFNIRQVDASADGFLFYERLGDLSDIGDGIAYLPHGTAAAFALADQCTFKHLDGPWYSWIGYS